MWHIDVVMTKTVLYVIRLRIESFLYRNPSTETMKRSFTISALDLINSLAISDYLPEHFNVYKVNIYNKCFARDKEDYSLTNIR